MKTATGSLASTYVLHLPGEESKKQVVSCSGSGELLAAATRLLGARASVHWEGAVVLPFSPMPPPFSTLTVSAVPPAPAPAPLSPPPPRLTMEQAAECAICMELFSAPYAPVPAGACSHGFHEICLRQWRSRSPYCPLCRGLMFPNADGAAGVAPASRPPTMEEALSLLQRMRTQLQSNHEWRASIGAVRETSREQQQQQQQQHQQLQQQHQEHSDQRHGGEGLLRTVAAQGGLSGHLAAAILSAATLGKVVHALGRGGGGAAVGTSPGRPPSAVCGGCGTLLGCPPCGARKFVCSECKSIVQV
jgi:hypothetical protein